MDVALIHSIWQQLILPIVRITCFVSIGLFFANFIESLNWTDRLAGLARPLIRIGNLSSVTGASFSVAFFSGVSANTMLAEAYDKGQMTKTELILANLFNTLPRFFLHLPTVFFLTAPLIKLGAIIYVSLTFAGALLQTALVIIAGKLLLKKNDGQTIEAIKTKKKSTWQESLQKSWRRLQKRIPRIFCYMAPIYILFFLGSRYGVFHSIERYIAANAWFLSWLNPKALGIVVLHVTAEFSAGLAAASALLADNSLSYREVVLALLVGNILSTPIRAIRHQLPYYTGIYAPRLALELIVTSQLFRGLSVMFVGIVYYFCSK
jgi:hypothetical protein